MLLWAQWANSPWWVHLGLTTSLQRFTQDELRLTTICNALVCNTLKPASLHEMRQCIISKTATLCTLALTTRFSGFLWQVTIICGVVKHKQRHLLNFLLQSQIPAEETWKHKIEREEGREFRTIFGCSNRVTLLRALTHIYGGSL